MLLYAIYELAGIVTFNMKSVSVHLVLLFLTSAQVQEA